MSEETLPPLAGVTALLHEHARRLRRAHSVTDEWLDSLDAGLSAGEFVLLTAIAANQGASEGMYAFQLGENPRQVQARAEQLHAKNLIEISVTNLGGKHLHLTDEGAVMSQALWEVINQANSGVPNDEEADDATDMLDLLAGLRQSVMAAGGRFSTPAPRSEEPSLGAPSGHNRPGASTAVSDDRHGDQKERVKLTVALPRADIGLLEKLGATWTNKTTALIRAIRTVSYLQEAAQRGSKVIVEDGDGTRREIIML